MSLYSALEFFDKHLLCSHAKFYSLAKQGSLAPSLSLFWEQTLCFSLHKLLCYPSDSLLHDFPHSWLCLLFPVLRIVIQ